MGAVALSFGAAQGPMALKSDSGTGETTISRGSRGLPAVPSGTSTIMGGEIRDVDPVLDRFTLAIPGEKSMKILFDERTQIFSDGKRIPLRQFRPTQHASVQTTLDGSSVFALSVHILSKVKEGEYRGEVAGFDPATGNLELVTGKGRDPITIRVTNETKFERIGQSSFASAKSDSSDLLQGTLVSIAFEPDGKGRGSATQITLLATPGSRFVFDGNLLSLDVHTGIMTLLDPRDNRNYQIAFDPGTASWNQIVHAGQHVRITAEYDGTRYVAQDVSPY
jgi:hypothetical protein